jgi:ParB family chromosome partitioning protein
MIRTIRLNKLVPSTRNVRRADDELADAQLKADIEARGLLQNLVVTSVARPRGCFAVEAGGRRLRALQGLAADGKLERDHEVCCLVVEGDAAEATEVSLAENFQRLAMNPADECLAFGRLVEQGADVEAIARRFGLTVRFVEGRLRLASLAPVVFDALGAGEIGLDVAKAYAATPDRERQAHVFEQMGRGYGAAHPDSIRRMMTQATASAGDRRARLVGEEAYLAAGGRIERDLFAEDAAARWLDIAILERLAVEKMEALALEAEAESGLGWVRPALDGWIGYAQTEGLQRVPVEIPPLTGEESALVDELEGAIEDLVAKLESEDCSDEVRTDTEAAIRGFGKRIEAIVDKPPIVDDMLKPTVGAFLILDEAGKPKLDAGRYAALSEDGDASAAPTSAPDEPKKGRGRAGLTQRLVDELAIQRRDILAVHVAADPRLALDLAAFLMVDRPGYSAGKSGSSLLAMAPSDPVAGFKAPEAAATAAAGEAADALDRGWTDLGTRAERFDAFRALSDEARAAWLGHAVARTLEASLNLAGPRACAFHDHLGRLLGIEVSRWWRPTGANYFDRVPKSMALEALAEVGGAALSGPYAGARKAELAQACERIFSGDFIGEGDVKKAALAWVPEPMRFAAPPDAPGEQDEGAAAPDMASREADEPAAGPGRAPVACEEVEEAA